MKKTGRCLLTFRYLGILCVLIFGIITIIGSASSPPQKTANEKMHERRMETLNLLSEEKNELKKAEFGWENKKRDLESDIYSFNNELKIYKKKEKEFIQKMSDEQLKIYSSYEEATNNENIAKQEICIRKLKKIFNREQKENLVELSEEIEYLELSEVTLIKREKSLKKDGENLAAWRNDWWRRVELLGSMMGSTIPAQSNTNPVMESMNSFQQTLEKQRQNRVMNSIDNSLKDISMSLKGW